MQTMITFRTMAPYRLAPAAETFMVTATVRGPFALVPMVGRIEAWDEDGAVLAFVEGLQRDGFEIVGEATAVISRRPVSG